MYDEESSNESPLCDPYRGPSKEGVMNSRIAGDIGYLSVKFLAKVVGCLDVTSPGGCPQM